MPESPAPQRPSPGEERLAIRLFLALSPRLARAAQPSAPSELQPCEDVGVPRTRGAGVLTATWYPAEREARGAVLLLHPWAPWGRAYFHRRGRLQALRAAGYHALALDLPGFGGSGPPAGFFDRDVEDGVHFLRRRTGRLPFHVWGVSAGGYWAHPLLTRTDWIAGAFFEDVSAHLFDWSWRTAPWGAPAYLFFRTVFRATHRFLDIRPHAAALKIKAAAYVSGDRDAGIRAEETAELARLTGGRSLVVPGAGHLSAIRAANAEVLELALETFEKAGGAAAPFPLPAPALALPQSALKM